MFCHFICHSYRLKPSWLFVFTFWHSIFDEFRSITLTLMNGMCVVFWLEKFFLFVITMNFVDSFIYVFCELFQRNKDTWVCNLIVLIYSVGCGVLSHLGNINIWDSFSCVPRLTPLTDVSDSGECVFLLFSGNPPGNVKCFWCHEHSARRQHGGGGPWLGWTRLRDTH